MLITWFTIKFAKIDWILKSVGSLRNDLDREALEGILGSLRWHKNLWFILLTSSTLLYVRLTFLHNQTRWATRFIRVLFHITGIARVDGVIYSTDPIFSSGGHVFYTCAFRMKSYEGWHALFNMNMSWVVMSPRFAIRVHSACWICEARIHSIRTEGVWDWTLSM
jgi:hypothetical protein